MKKASKLLVLEFIWKREIVTPLDLMDNFGYSRGGASWMLTWLKKQRLVINDRRGEWTITDDGMRRLIYYGRL
jgi:predicted transcriptional regulator